MAHGMRLDHPIFNTPLKPRIEQTEIATPKNYLNWPEGHDCPPKIPGWKVHEGEFPKVDVGLVADPYGFEDSPDAEWISSGVNSKGPRSVALGRHGNYFMWGFWGDPSMMTDSARQVFINTIHYMKKFTGQRPLITKQGQSREWSLVYAGYVRELGGKKDTEAFLNNLFGERIKNEIGLDADKLETYFKAKLEYLHPVSPSFDVDPDLEQLNLSNRKLEFFDALVERLADDPEDPVSKRLLDRYAKGLTTPAELDVWLGSHRDRLFFSDVGGYRWFLKPAPAPAR